MEGLNPIQICMVEVSSNNIRHLEDGINKDPTLISSGILLKNFSETFSSNGVCRKVAFFVGCFNKICEPWLVQEYV